MFRITVACKGHQVLFTSHSKTEHDVDNSVPPTECTFIVDYWHEWLVYPTQYTYRSLVKECPWLEHLTSLPKRGGDLH